MASQNIRQNTKEQAKEFRIQHNGRNFPLGKNGTIRYLDTAAFQPIIKDGLEMEHYLSRLTAYILGGDDVFKQIFGDDIIGHCKAAQGDQTVNGLTIPAALAKEDCTPSVLRLYDPSMGEFLRGSAKLKAILSTYPVIPLGELPSWDMGYSDAGEKDDAEVNEAAKNLPRSAG